MKINETQLEAMLQQLPKAAEQGLSGLTAGDALKTRIQLAAAEQKAPRTRFSMNSAIRWTGVACCRALLALVRAFTMPGQPLQPDQPDGLITSGTLGDGPTEAPPITADLGSSGVFIRAGNSNPDYRTLWAPASGGSFPLIGVDGKYYRLLTTPRNVDGSLRGSTLGTISEYTTEPSLAGTNTVLSNVVAFGETVYAVRGMEDTLVIARVDGQMRLFQRVSFNGNARRGREKLSDTLQVSGHVIGLELTGVGTITDPAVCDKLIETLFDCASYESSGSISSRQSLIIELDNGLVVQLAVKSDSIAACGVWSCPEFFEAFEDACN